MGYPDLNRALEIKIMDQESDYVKKLESVLADYIQRFGMTDMAREVFRPTAVCARIDSQNDGDRSDKE